MDEIEHWIKWSNNNMKERFAQEVLHNLQM